MTSQVITKNEILSNITSVLHSQLGSNLLEYICPNSIVSLKVVYIFIYFIMKDTMIIKLHDGYKEMTEIPFDKAHKAHISSKTQKNITQLYDDITNNTLSKQHMYIKCRYFTQFIPISYKVFSIFYNMNLQCSNTQTYMPVILGIYVMIKTITH
jgi:hypothetical protein